ncbi:MULTISPECIES: hypothetical protein [unclassified Nocardia]|uniref:hypothetical protein n=1 Tax=unclassified Nocardia TaxID=2637762 RepID=UPI00278BD87B|nr:MULTISPECIES: hypothetical protein [unclassified Nocardia]
MSACISEWGEFSEHDCYQSEFVCERCWFEDTAKMRARITELESGRDQIATKLANHRATSTRCFSTGEYKNPVRQGYDRGLTEALALLGIDAQEVNRA